MTKLRPSLPLLALSALLTTACGASRSAPIEAAMPGPPRIALAEVGDSVMYLEQARALTIIERPADTLIVTSRQDAVIHVVRTAPDTLEAFYEHLLIRFEGGGQPRALDTQPLIGDRFVLYDDDGRITTVSAPDLPPSLRQMTHLRRQFEDFFMSIPDRPLQLGTEWVDTARFTSAADESTTERLAVTRYRVRGDTVVEGVAARTVDYTSAIEATVRSAPATQGTLTSTLVGEEEGTFVFAPDRELMLARTRIGVLEGELVVEGNLETRRFPQSYSYDSTISLLPPAPPAGVEPAETPAAEVPAMM